MGERGGVQTGRKKETEICQRGEERKLGKMRQEWKLSVGTFHTFF